MRLFNFLIAFALSVIPLSVRAADSVKIVPATTFFPYLEKFLSLPSDQRNAINVNYHVFVKGGKITALHFLNGGQKTPIQLATDGKILNLPNLQSLKSGKVEIIGSGKGGGMSLSAAPAIPYSNVVQMTQIWDALSDFQSAMKIAGPLALMIPKQKSIAFLGVNSGRIIYANGSQKSISGDGKKIIITPSLNDFKNAIRIEFASKPTQIDYSK